jgi:tryptophan-rich sensory protein
MDWIIAVGLVGAAFSAATTGAVFKPGRWYETLDKPSWTPPNMLFPIAWTVLYAMMTYAAFRIASGLAAGDFAVQPAHWAAAGLAFWAMQITLNAMWSPLFFGIRQPRAALVCVGALWIAIAATILCFARVDAIAAGLLIPYLLWASYAGALNLSIMRRNAPQAFGLPGAG